MLLVASFLTVLGFSAVPFAIVDSAVNAALIAGIFSVVNTALNGLVLRQARRNAQLTRGTAARLDVVHATARESTEELRDVKRKVRGERRRTDRRRQERRGDDD